MIDMHKNNLRGIFTGLRSRETPFESLSITESPLSELLLELCMKLHLMLLSWYEFWLDIRFDEVDVESLSLNRDSGFSRDLVIFAVCKIVCPSSKSFSGLS